MERIGVDLTLNGKATHLEIEPWTTLLDALREHLQMTGTKKGCDHGQCGACTVLVDGDTRERLPDPRGDARRRRRSRPSKASAHPKRCIRCRPPSSRATRFQCGYCTPGQICSAVGLINEGHAKTPDEIRELMSGNLCRCGAYPNILAAIEQVLGAAQ